MELFARVAEAGGLKDLSVKVASFQLFENLKNLLTAFRSM
jgi:hypothetical protein